MFPIMIIQYRSSATADISNRGTLLTLIISFYQLN
jgi:hypothetical protein